MCDYMATKKSRRPSEPVERVAGVDPKTEKVAEAAKAYVLWCLARRPPGRPEFSWESARKNDAWFALVRAVREAWPEHVDKVENGVQQSDVDDAVFEALGMLPPRV